MNRLLQFAIVLLVLFGMHVGAGAQPEQPKPTHEDVRYGPHDRNVLDVYKADTKEPAPVLIYFHGGGWIQGDKRPVAAAPFVHHGITVIAANYRFTTGTKDAAPYPAPMEDGARVVQFVRSKAKEWNIDPDRIALTGGSAGAVISMWIAYRDDMAKPRSKDPVERFSTRVACIVPVAGPTTLDPKLIVQRIGGSPQVHPALLPFFGVKDLAELEDEAKQNLVADASPITHVTADDPPTFLIYGFPLGGTPLPADANVNLSIHHPEFGVLLKEKLDAAGVENALQSKDDGSDPNAMWSFLFKHLKPERAALEAPEASQPSGALGASRGLRARYNPVSGAGGPVTGDDHVRYVLSEDGRGSPQAAHQAAARSREKLQGRGVALRARGHHGRLRPGLFDHVPPAPADAGEGVQA